MEEHPLTLESKSIPEPIQRIPFFQTLATETLQEILKNSTIVDCQPGEHIAEEGDEDRSLLFLLKGRVRVVKDGTLIAAAGGSGVLLGEMATLRDHARSATIIASDHVFCLKVDPSFLTTLSAEEQNAYYAATYRFLANLLAERLEQTSDKLVRAEQIIMNLQRGKEDAG